MFKNEKVDAVVCSTGGYSSVQILPYLDFETIKKHPKPIVGLSDNSVLLNAIYQKTGLMTFHGPTVMYGLADIGEHSNYPTKGKITGDSFKRTLEEGERFDFKDYNFPNKEIDFLREGRATGRGFGGNLTSLMDILKTEYFPNTEDSILFWEATDELHLIDERLSAYKLAGVFGNISGMVIGYTGACENNEFPKGCQTVEQMILEHTKEYDFPIVSCPKFGHFIENVTFPIGVKYEINPLREVKITEKYLREK